MQKVFLGSGLLFLCLTIIGAALAAGLLSSYAVESGILVQRAYGPAVGKGYVLSSTSMPYAWQVCSGYNLASIWLRNGLMHRGGAFLTCILALVLLLSIDESFWVILIFPGWVLVVSVIILICNLRTKPKEDSSRVDTTSR